MRSDWKKTTIDEVCSRIYSGGTPSTKEPKYWNGDINWLSSGETRNKFIYGTERKITRLGVEESSTQLALKDSVVIATAGQGYTRGQASFLKIDTYVNQSVLVFEADTQVIEPLFLYYNLSNRYEELRQLSDGTSTRGGLSGWIVKRMDIDLPSLSLQKKIVDILYDIDQKIECNTAINKNLEEQARAIFKNLFIDLTPFSTDGSLPLGWRGGKVNEIVEFHDAKRIPLSNAMRVNMEKIYPYYGATSCMDYVDDYIFEGTYLLLGEDGTVIDKNGFPILQYVDGKFWVNNHAHILTGKTGFSVEWLYLMFSMTKVDSIVTGAVQPKISQSNLKKIALIIPPFDVLSSFDRIIQPMFVKLRNNRLENMRLAELRDFLLPRLMSGEIDVSDIAL